MLVPIEPKGWRQRSLIITGEGRSCGSGQKMGPGHARARSGPGPTLVTQVTRWVRCVTWNARGSDVRTHTRDEQRGVQWRCAGTPRAMQGRATASLRVSETAGVTARR